MLVPTTFFAELRREFAWSEQGIYVPELVIWLMVRQQLFGRGTLREAVELVVSGQPGNLLPDHKRIREERVSSNTGAYSQARQLLPVDGLEAVGQRLFDGTLAAHPDAGHAGHVYLLDGSGLLLQHTRELAKAFPPSDQPTGRVALARHADSGGALSGQWNCCAT